MTRHGPWICFNGIEGLTATNTLYTVKFAKGTTWTEKFAIALALLTTSVRRQVNQIARRYPDGLLKVEPGKLAQVRIPALPRVRGVVAQYKSAIESLLDDDIERATRIADRWFSARGGTSV